MSEQNEREINPPSLARLAPAMLLVCVWGVLTLWSHQTQTFLETLNITALLVVGMVIFFVGGGAARLSASAGGRMSLAGIFSAAMMALCPAFHRISAAQSLKGMDTATLSATLAPIVVTGGFLLVAMICPVPGHRNNFSGTPSAAERLEAFLLSPGVRLQLFFFALLSVPAAVALGGLPLRAAGIPLLFVTLMLLSLKLLLNLASHQVGAGVLSVTPLLALGFAALMGLNQYRILRGDVALTKQHLESGNATESKAAYDRASALSLRLHVPGPRVELESAVAEHFEKSNNFQPAAEHWTKVAILKKVSGENFPPLQRAQLAQGDSLMAWRRLVFEGIDAVNTPDLAPGIARLGFVAGDVRGKLLAALLAWERKEPDANRLKLLEAAQLLSPGEPTSFNLLKRMKATLPELKDATMWLPIELFVGRKPSGGSINGTIEDLGEVGTVVYLEEGHYEMSLRASGTPLHEEWPIVRVELNGQILGPTQVNKSTEHDVPFTFDVRRRDLFSLRVIFQNHKIDLEEGRIARRGLKLMGIKFRHGKN